MNSNSSHPGPHPKRLKTLAFDAKNSEGNNLLHRLVLDHCEGNHPGSENHIDIVLRSMSGVQVNALNHEGYSALHLAILKQNLLMVKKLLSCLVNINVNTKCDYRRDKNTALHLAVKLGYLDIVQELLHKGANIDIKNGCHDTALCLAVQSGNLEIIKLLVSEGANINLKDRGTFPLHYAVQSGNLETVQFLVCNGADVNVKDDYNRTPLHEAVHARSLGVVQFLVNNCADVNAKDEDNRTPLHEAVHVKSLEIVQFLVNNCADVDAKDDNNRSPLDEAIERGQNRDFETLGSYIRCTQYQCVKSGSHLDVTAIDDLNKTYYIYICL